MSFIINNKMIEIGLDNWDFDRVAELKRKQTMLDFNYNPEYCKYLADIGYLDEIIVHLGSLPLFHKYSTEKSFQVCVHLLDIDRKMLNSDTFFAKLYQTTKSKNACEVLKLLKSEWDVHVNHGTSPEDNMILNYSLNLLFEEFLIDEDILIKLIHHLNSAKNMNNIRRKFLLNRSIRYIVENKILASNFFKLKDRLYNHIQRVLYEIYRFCNEKGAKILQQIFYDAIKQYNSLSLLKPELHKNPKIALCISGINRGDMEALRGIVDKIVVPLNADVFMHTWDVQQDWMGNSRPFAFWIRTFGVRDVPNNLTNFNFIKSHYPNVYNCLVTSHYSPLDKNKLLDKFKFQGFLCENQDEFMDEYNIGDSYMARDSFNQIKMFYGIYKSFQIMKDYESKNNMKYDYVIRIRPDLSLSTQFSLEDFSMLDSSKLAVGVSPDPGVSDYFFYADRETYERVVNIWESMIHVKRLSPFEYFPKYDCHALMMAWLVHKNIHPVTVIQSSILPTSKDVKIPNLKQALAQDCNSDIRTQYPKETEWLENFLKDKAQ